MCGNFHVDFVNCDATKFLRAVYSSHWITASCYLSDSFSQTAQFLFSIWLNFLLLCELSVSLACKAVTKKHSAKRTRKKPSKCRLRIIFVLGAFFEMCCCIKSESNTVGECCGLIRRMPPWTDQLNLHLSRLPLLLGQLLFFMLGVK